MKKTADTRIPISKLDQIDTFDVMTVALEAGQAIMEIYERDFAVEYKEDDSPLTEADRKAHEIITEGLNELAIRNPEPGTPESALPILSEEGRDIPYGERKEWEYFWMVDPIDGTKEFIKKNGEFTVNIALIHRDTPVLGVVYAPALGEIYWAKKDEGAWKAPVDSRWSIVESEKKKLPLKNSTSNIQHSTLTIVASKSHLNEETQKFIDTITRHTEHVRLISRGSSLKLLMVAEGSADVYPRLAPTMEWDMAAADAIVREAGGEVNQYLPEQGESMKAVEYNKKELLNPWFVVRFGGRN